MCKKCDPNKCSKCNKTVCTDCIYQCTSCNVFHCVECFKKYQCEKCSTFSCKLCKCGRICIPAGMQVYKFTSTSQFSCSNTSHWQVGNMLDPTLQNSQFAFDNKSNGWVCWDMSSNPKKISRLIYYAGSSKNIVAEYSNDGSTFTEAARFTDNGFNDVSFDVDKSYSYWRIRITSAASSGPWHYAVWCY